MGTADMYCLCHAATCCCSRFRADTKARRASMSTHDSDMSSSVLLRARLCGDLAVLVVGAACGSSNNVMAFALRAVGGEKGASKNGGNRGLLCCSRVSAGCCRAVHMKSHTSCHVEIAPVLCSSDNMPPRLASLTLSAAITSVLVGADARRGGRAIVRCRRAHRCRKCVGLPALWACNSSNSEEAAARSALFAMSTDIVRERRQRLPVTHYKWPAWRGSLIHHGPNHRGSTTTTPSVPMRTAVWCCCHAQKLLKDPTPANRTVNGREG